MKGYRPQEFCDLLVENGWQSDRRNSSHKTFYKEGCSNIITVVCKGKELSRPMAKRLLKEAGIHI